VGKSYESFNERKRIEKKILERDMESFHLEDY